MKALFLKILLLLIVVVIPFQFALSQNSSGDPLPSWNEGKLKTSIKDFVISVTTPSSPLYVRPEERIATFDNDGTLWCEQPTIQAVFTIDRVKEMYPSHPEWKNEEIFTAVLNDDKKYLEEDYETGAKGIMEVLAATYTGISVEEFSKDVSNFFDTARHPKFNQSYKKVYYVPMLELLNYLRANNFNVYICSGGGTDFMRVISEDVYGIPPENVIGSFVKAKYEMINGEMKIMKEPDLILINDKEGKPVGIDLFIGRKPIFSAGNEKTGGDIAMLTYCQSNVLPNFQLLVNHDDAVREFEYSEKGNESLNAAEKNGWNVISMKNDWKKIFEFQ